MKKMEISGEKIEKMLKKHYRKAERAVRPAPVALPVGESGAVLRFRPSGASRMASAAAFALCGLGIVSMVILFALSGNGFGSKLKPNPVGYQPDEPKTDSSDVRYAHFDYRDYYLNGTNEGTEEFLALLAAEKGDESILDGEAINVTTDLVREKMGIEIFAVDCGLITLEPESPGNLYNGYYYLKDGKPIRWLQVSEVYALGCFLPCDFDGDGNYDLLYAKTLFSSRELDSSIRIYNLETGKEKCLIDYHEPADDSLRHTLYNITPDEPFDGQNFTVWNWTFKDDLYYEAARITAENGQPKVTIHDLVTPPPSIADVRYAHLERDWINNRSDRGVDEFLAKLAEEYGDDTILNAECYNITSDLVREKTGVEIFHVESTPGPLHHGLSGYYFQKEGKIFFSDNGFTSIYDSVVPCDFDGDGNYELLFSRSYGSGVFYATIGILYPESGETKYLSDSYIYSDFIITPDDPFDGQNFTVWNWCDENLYYEVGRITSENGQPKVGIDSDPIPHPITPVDPNVTDPKPDPSTPQTTQPKPETTNPQTPTPKPTVPEPVVLPDWILALSDRAREAISEMIDGTLEEACQYNGLQLIGQYDDCYVFIDYTGQAPEEEITRIVGGYRFWLGSHRGIFVCRGDELLSLEKAYESGWLSESQMEQLNADHRARYSFLKPTVYGIEMPSIAEINAIEQAWSNAKSYNVVLWGDNLLYYGAYGSGAVIYGKDWRIEAHTLRIAGNDFELDGGSLWYYQDGTLTELSAAYENGWLTADQIAEIAAYHANYPG